MNMSTYISIKRIVFLVTLTLALCGATPSVFAAGLDVTFQSDPLFYDLNIVPGSSVTRFVTVSNSGPETENVYFDTVNDYSDGLADVIQLDIASASVSYYSGTFTTLFSISEVPLGTLSSGQSRTYTFTATMDSASDNTYQSSTMGFDVCVGFSGGTMQCDGGTGTITTPNQTSSGGGSRAPFRLLNEAVDSVDLNNRVATIRWNTNRDATSYMVCGNVQDGLFDLNPSAQYFGYEFDTLEITNTTKTHVVQVVLPTDDTYECRPASRENTSDNFTVGKSLSIFIPSGLVDGIDTSTIASTNSAGVGGTPYARSGQVQGEATSTATTTNTELDTVQDTGSQDRIRQNREEDSVVNTVPQETGSQCSYIWLLLLLLISLTWSVFADRTTFHVFFYRQVAFSIVYVVAWLCSYWLSVLPIVWWLFALSWCVMVGLDYYGHTSEKFEWNPKNRNLFYFLMSTLFVVTSLWFSFLCVWWPFAVIALTSVLFLVIQKR